MECVACGGRADVSGADHIVAEPFAARTPLGVFAKQRRECGNDRIVAYVPAVQLVQPVPSKAPPR